MTPSLATTNSSMTIQSSGTILYPSPTPTPSPSPSPINYASIDKWAPYTYEPYSYPSPQITFLDTSVLFYGQPTIRIDKHHDGLDPNIYNELDLCMIPIEPGDHIIMKVWIKTDNLPNYVYNPNDWRTWGGARMVIDYYDDQHRAIVGMANPNGAVPQTDEGVRENYVMWNTSSWTQRTIEFVVPNKIPAAYVVYPPLVDRTPRYIAPTIQRLNPNNNPDAEGSAWFANPELYINP